MLSTHRSIPGVMVGAVLLLFLAAFAERVHAQQPTEHALGAVDFPVSCSPAVQADFNRAIGLLHHMMYVESQQAFETTARREPACAMAHWGIAMTLFQPLWPTRPSAEALARGRSLVAKARELNPPTERERDFVTAAGAFYDDPAADWWTRIRNWEAALAQAYAARPDDNETAAFYALSHIAAGLVAEDRMAHQARAAEILLQIYEREPAHPGALHYTIHANDVDGRADESLELVRSYDDVAPSVPHALHMPTHIFVRLGEWPEVIEWNRKSADAALEFPAGDATSHHYIHAMDYLLYARLQRGEDEQARALLDEAMHKGRHQNSFISGYHAAAMPARYAVERREWAEAKALEPRVPDYLSWDAYQWPEALTWFGKGLGAIHTGDVAAARRAEARMIELRVAAENAGERDNATYIEIDRLILAGRIAHARGDTAKAVQLVRDAAQLERTMQKHPVTPGALVPANEALGDLLADLGRPAEALAAYQASRDVWPKRLNTLLGAARAAKAAGQPATAREYYAELLDIVGPDATRPGVKEAQEFMRMAAR